MFLDTPPMIHTLLPLVSWLIPNGGRPTHPSHQTLWEGYYKNSRLHHLSTWKAELKNLVQEAQERTETPGGMQLVGRVASEIPEVAECVSMRGAELVMKSPSKAKGKGKEKAVDDRSIMHCDFDFFFSFLLDC